MISPKTSELKRVLGLPSLTFYGTGMILGAGIYSLIGKAAGLAGESVWQSLILAAIAAALAALSYAELSTMYPRVGGEYVYLRQAFSEQRWVAKTVGLMMSFAGIATAAAVSMAFAGYLQQFIVSAPELIAVSLLAIFTIVNLVGVREASWINVIFTMIEISGLLIFIAIGIHAPVFGQALLSTPTFGTLSASALIIFAYFGFENIVNFAEETCHPDETLPRAIFLSIGISMSLYILAALSAVALLPLDVLSKSEAPIADAIAPVSRTVAGVLSGIALFATANTVLISLVTTSRVLLGMAWDKSLPRVFSSISSRRGVPWVAALISFAFACALLPLKKVEILTSISSFATMAAFISVHIAVLRLRIIAPAQHRSFRIPLSVKNVSIFPVLGIFVSVLLLSLFDPVVYVVGGGFLMFLLLEQALAYFLTGPNPTRFQS